MKYKFNAEIRDSENNEFYAALVGKNGEDVFTGETKKTKRSVKILLNKWFPGILIKEVFDKKKKNVGSVLLKNRPTGNPGIRNKA